MARRKKLILSEEDPDSDGSGSSGSAEVDAQGMSRKRKRGGRDRKEEAIYGVFGDDEEEEPSGGRGKGKGTKGSQKVDYTRGPAFVSASSKKEGAATSDSEDAQQSDSGSSDSEGEAELSEAEELARKPITEEEELETRSTFGLGSRGPTGEAAAARQALNQKGFQPSSFVSSRSGIGKKAEKEDVSAEMEVEMVDGRGGIGSGRGGIGSSRGGIGSSSNSSDPQASTSFHPTFEASALSSAGVPSAFGGVSSPAVAPSDAFKKKRSFLPEANKPSTSYFSGGVPKTNIKFGSGAGGGFNPAAMMAKMGWTGGGLGKEGEGMVNPVEVSLRPEKAGIAFGGRKERTKQEKEEARRRGQELSSDEEDKKSRRKGKGKGFEDKEEKRKRKEAAKEQQSQAWTKAEKKVRKPKVEHRTYEQIIEAAGGIPVTDSGLGQIIDATGAELREITSLTSALSHHAVPTSDSTRLPELRHNLRLICDQNKQNLDLLAKDGASIFDRRRWLQRELEEAKRRLEAEELEKKRLNEILQIVVEIEGLGKKAKVDESIDLESFSPLVERLVKDFEKEVKTHSLDEAVVGAIVPIIRRIISSWSPLEEPFSMTRVLKRWSSVLQISDPSSEFFVDQYGSTRRRDPLSGKGKAVMTPYESLLWNIWMPKIRSSINNDWKSTNPLPAVALLEAWKPLLPRFILDNITDQLVLPKVQSAVSEWEPKRSKVGLHHIVFPWLPVFSERMASIVQDSRRRLKGVLKNWKPIDGVLAGLEKWKEVISSSDWDFLLLTTVVPKLSSSLRTDLQINPSSQNMTPLQNVISWSPSLRPSVLSRVIESEMFPKWLEVLHLWLTQKGANFDEVAQWYSFWKSWFPTEIVSLPGVAQGFQRGLNLINEAISLPSDQRSTLRKPDTTPLSRSSFETAEKARSLTSKQQKSHNGNGMVEDEGTSFRSIVEEAATSADLLILPGVGTHPKTGLPILRISKNVDGKGGKNFYLDEDVVWVEKKGAESGGVEWAPVGVDDLVKSVR